MKMKMKMKMKTLIYILLFLPPNTFALCGINPEKFRDLEKTSAHIEQVAIIGTEDGRLEMAKAYRRQGFSDAEYQQARTSQGWIYCPHSDAFRGNGGIATVVGDKATLATASHVLHDVYGNLRDNVAECYFINHANPKIKHRIVVSSIEPSAPGKLIDVINDNMRFRIEPPVSESKPYEVDKTDSRLAPGQKVFMFSGIRTPDKRIVPGPTSQVCFNRDDVPKDADGNQGTKTECDSKPGDSGGALMIRSASGSLRYKGTLSGQGTNMEDHCEYDADTCYTSFSLATGPFLQSLRSLSQVGSSE